jgi:hypothetical protein
MIEKFDKSRELFTSSDVLEPEEETKIREEQQIDDWVRNQENYYKFKAFRGVLDSPETKQKIASCVQNKHEWQEFLNRVDFSALKKVFVRIAARCQIPEDKMNFLDKQRVFPIETFDGEGGGSQYFPDRNVILLSIPNIETKEIYKKVYGNSDMLGLAYLVHEETHATARNICVGLVNQGRGHDEFFQKIQNGFSRTHIDPEEESRYAQSSYGAFFAFNEGMIEKLSQEILFAYTEEVNWPEEKVGPYRKTLKENSKDDVYSSEVSLIDAIIKGLAKKNGQSERVVWESLVNALLHGENFEENEIVELFEEAFGPSFLVDLAELSSLATGGENKYIEEFKSKYGLK